MGVSDHPVNEEPEEREVESEPREGTRRTLEQLIRDGVKRVVEKGIEQITEGPETLRHYMQDRKLPRELAHLIFQQMDETKNGLYRVVVKELRDFLEHTNLADELTRVLTTLSFEIKTEIRFIPNDQKADKDASGKLPRPDVKASVKVRDNDHKEPLVTRTKQ